MRLGQQLRELYATAASEEVPSPLLDLITQLGRVESGTVSHSRDESVRRELLACLPKLRVFALSLSRTRDRADDLVQETLLKAWSHRAEFEIGTNLQAWLATICRNTFLSQRRKRMREVEDPDDVLAARLAVAPRQQQGLDLQDLWVALCELSPDQRRTVLLVGAEGLTHDEAARILQVAPGTVKSRLSRARERLARLIGVESSEDLQGTDGPTRAAVAHSSR